MAGYVCSYCKRCSGVTKVANGPNKGAEKPAMSERGCDKSPSGTHHWVKK